MWHTKAQTRVDQWRCILRLWLGGNRKLIYAVDVVDGRGLATAGVWPVGVAEGKSGGRSRGRKRGEGGGEQGEWFWWSKTLVFWVYLYGHQGKGKQEGRAEDRSCDHVITWLLAWKWKIGNSRSKRSCHTFLIGRSIEEVFFLFYASYVPIRLARLEIHLLCKKNKSPWEIEGPIQQ